VSHRRWQVLASDIFALERAGVADHDDAPLIGRQLSVAVRLALLDRMEHGPRRLGHNDETSPLAHAEVVGLESNLAQIVSRFAHFSSSIGKWVWVKITDEASCLG
jgi:hypothetical protein